MTLNLQQKGLVTRFTHVKYEGRKSYQLKDMANVKVFADKQTDKQMGQQLYALDLSMQRHKNLSFPLLFSKISNMMTLI